MKNTTRFLLLVSLAVSVCAAQEELSTPDILPRRAIRQFAPGRPRPEFPIPYKIPGKKASQYTAEDWGRLIDSTWGPGQPASDQLNIFDTFWNQVRQQWAGFPNLALNCSYWDSVRNVWRPQIGSGLSRGRFYALMSRMWLALMEFHTGIYDMRIDSILLSGGSLHPRRGVPLLLMGNWWWDPLGAPVTPLPDSTNVVYRAAPGNPLGLQPGDLVLGYDGIPWKYLYRSLLDAGLPVSYYFAQSGSTPASRTFAFLHALGWNWGLFDTIDVVKYSTGDTLHLSTVPLDTVFQTVFASDQVPVAGVPLPLEPGSAVAVSWGVVQGTNVGYIYVWDWATTQTRTLFQNAVDDLIHTRRVTGLVLDFRTNFGGYFAYGNGGLSQIFNFDGTSNLRTASRNSVSDCMTFNLSAAPGAFVPTTLYDHPIAVLTGPGCWSVGDYNAFRMRLHPMARSFGKPTNGACVAAGGYVTGSFPGGWEYKFPRSGIYSNLSGEGYLIHKGAQPDEEVWLTRSGVANGEDDVVKRALAWMDSLSYAHDVMVSRDTVWNVADSIRITAKVENPGNHALVVSAIVTTAQGAVVDSVVLTNAPGDSVWGKFIRVPSANGRYNVSVRTTDVTAGTYRRLPNVAWFIAIVTDVDDLAENLPQVFDLQQNYPNPFNPSTRIKYQLPLQRHVTLKVYNLLGQEVTTLVDRVEEPGYKSVQWDGSKVAGGVYLYRLQAGDFVDVKKLILLK